jgi:hypothetical protein
VYFDGFFKDMIYGASTDWGSETYDFERDEPRLGLGAQIASKLPSDSAPQLRAMVAASLVSFPLDPGIPIDFTRPMYPYPLFAKYREGDPNKAASFRPATPSP